MTTTQTTVGKSIGDENAEPSEQEVVFVPDGEPAPSTAIVQHVPRQIVEAKREALAQFIPAKADLDRFIASAAFALARKPELADCTRVSIQEAVCTAAELGLDFSPSLGLAYLVPYRDGKTMRCQLQIGYRGLARLAGLSGISIEAHTVHEADRFVQQRGTVGSIVHEPPPLGTVRGQIVGAYSVARFSDGHKQFDVMDIGEINAIRGRSMADKFGKSPWQTDFAEMCKKTPTRRLCKYLNINSPEMAKALAADNEDFDTDGIRGAQPRVVPVVDPAADIAALPQAAPTTTNGTRAAAPGVDSSSTGGSSASSPGAAPSPASNGAKNGRGKAVAG